MRGSLAEIAADDLPAAVRIAKAIRERPNHMNRNIPDPRQVQGLGTWMKGWGG
jgi:hypothetical protein